MIEGTQISEHLRQKNLQKKDEELRRRKAMIREIDRRLQDNQKSPFVLSAEQKEQVHTYWDPYTDSNAKGWIEYYSGLYGEYDVRFLPDTVYYMDIDPFYNNRSAAKYIDHKCFYSRLFPQIKQPETIAQKINGFWLDANFDSIQMDEILRRCQEAGKVIIKPAVNFCGGAGIFIWNAQKEGIGRLENILRRTVVDTVIQVFLKQHCEMEKLHRSSVNTIRTVSFYHKNKTHLLSSVVRMGVGESEVDNVSAGGISAGILENGRLKNSGFDKYGTCFPEHPDGAVFRECRIPCYDRICEHIVDAHKFLPHFRLISWDFAVDCEGNPVLIEANLMNGELDFHQINNGPLFHELTEEVLWEVYGKRCKDAEKH